MRKSCLFGWIPIFDPNILGLSTLRHEIAPKSLLVLIDEQADVTSEIPSSVLKFKVFQNLAHTSNSWA